MLGKRLPDGDHPAEPGEYAKFTIRAGGVDVIAWIVKVPTGGAACIIGKPNADGSAYHWVEEHDDGTITVRPNPSDAPTERRNSNSIAWNGWHGYIYRGEWRGA